MSKFAPRKINQIPIIKYKNGITLAKPRLNIDLGKEPTKEKTKSKGNVPKPNKTIKRKLLVKESAFIAEAIAI